MRRFLLLVSLIAVSACSSTSSNADLSTTTVASDAPPSSAEDTSITLTSHCEDVRQVEPQEVEYDNWDAPGVVTTDIEIDGQGNKIVSGLISDEADFDYRDTRRTVGVNGYGFQFVAKFDPKSRFLWIHCLRQESLYHWYQGPRVEVDVAGNVYTCDTTLAKMSPSGEEVWNSSLPGLTEETMNQGLRNCVASRDGRLIHVGSGPTTLVSPDGEVLWQRDIGVFSSSRFLSNGNIALASNSSLVVVNPEGDIVWQSNRPQRSDIGPEGLIDVSNAFSTVQTGLVSDDENIVIATSLNKVADFDPDPENATVRPRWIQDGVVAQYTLSGELLWTTKISLPGVETNATRFVEVFDTELTRDGQIVVFGGSSPSHGNEPMKLFLAKFSSDGEQLRFLWLGEYTGFIHNMGRHVAVDSRNRVYATSEGLTIPPFVLSRDLR